MVHLRARAALVCIVSILLVSVVTAHAAQPGRLLAEKGPAPSVRTEQSLPALLGKVWVQQGPEFLAIDHRLGRVFVISSRNVITTLDARTGRRLHEARSGDRPGQAAADDLTGRVFVPNIGGTAQMLDARTGVVLRTIRLPGNPGDTVVAERTGHVFVGNYGHDPLAVLDARTGSLLRLVSVGKDPGILAIDHRTGRVFAATWDHHRLGVLDTGTGSLLRMVDIGKKPIRVVVDEATDRVFVTSEYVPPGPTFRPVRLITMLDARNGRVLRSIHLAASPASIVVAQSVGRVLVAEVRRSVSTGAIAVYGARTGTFLHRVTLPGGPVGDMAVDEQRGHLFLTSNLVGSNTLRVLDLRSLALLETIHHIGTDTAAMAIDQPTRHLFLANMRNSVSVVDLGS